MVSIWVVGRRDVFRLLTCWDLVKVVWLAIMQVVMMVLGIPVCAFGLLFCRESDEHMPGVFWPWDNDVDSINGCIGWEYICKTRWYLGNPRSYWSRFYWCALRNPCRNYSMWVGVRPCDVEEVWINREYDPGRPQCNSLLVLARTWDDKRYVMWMPVWKLTKTRTMLGKFGFKFWDLPAQVAAGDEEKRQFVFYPSFQKDMGC